MHRWCKTKTHPRTCARKETGTRSCRCVTGVLWRRQRRWNRGWDPWAGKKHIYGRNGGLRCHPQSWVSSGKRSSRRTGNEGLGWRHRRWRGETRPSKGAAEGDNPAARTTATAWGGPEPWTGRGFPPPAAPPTGNSLPTSGRPWPAGGQCGVGAGTSYWELWAQNSIINNHLWRRARRVGRYSAPKAQI